MKSFKVIIDQTQNQIAVSVTHFHFELNECNKLTKNKISIENKVLSMQFNTVF